MREYIKLKINYIKNTFKNNKKKYIAMSIIIASIVVLFGLGFLIMYKIRTRKWDSYDLPYRERYTKISYINKIVYDKPLSLNHSNSSKQKQYIKRMEDEYRDAA